MDAATRPLATNLAATFAGIEEPWVPHVVGELNGQLMKAVKFLGEYVWHTHADQDEMFLVVRGRIVIELRAGPITVRGGEFFIVPRGTEHRPTAEHEAHVVLFEPLETRSTGDVDEARTLEPDELPRV